MHSIWPGNERNTWGGLHSDVSDCGFTVARPRGRRCIVRIIGKMILNSSSISWILGFVSLVANFRGQTSFEKEVQLFLNVASSTEEQILARAERHGH